ncbi:hypothetical protein OHV05_00750 [Kitasatospora sp. NBC_00070]|uniref:hypothetical protein n=1 Tax=Kitasatospora sp. NBC_00070 TaxID=2975962 RepID=UPI00324F821E
MRALRYLIAPLALGMALMGVASSAAVPADVTKLGNADNGRTVNLTVDQYAAVQLGDEAGDGYTITYGAPTSSEKAVVALDGEQAGNFKAAAKGTTNITAEATCTESDEAADPKKCPDPVPAWNVTITVTDVVAPE